MSTFFEKRKQQLGIRSLGEKLADGSIGSATNPANFVHGPPHIDCLEEKWERGCMMGLIGASGSGKTELVLEIFEHILKNSTKPDSVCVFVSLEMSESQIAKRWIRRVGKNSPLTNRLYVVTNYHQDGKARKMTVGDIINEISVIKNALKVDVISTAIDHLHIIERESQDDLNRICHLVKNLAVELNTFAILLSQTQKENNGGDIPLDQNASHNCSQFAWISTWVLTIHAPLKKVGNLTNMNILAWQYAKIREKSPNDKVKVGINQLLSYDMQTGKLSELTIEQETEFGFLYTQVLELRKAEEDSKFAQYNLGKKKISIDNGEKIFKE